MRRKKALINILFSLVLEFVTVVSGFIVPRLIISSFGSDVNGLVNSITSFIGYISVLQLGVGSVIKAALYKPLAKKDKDSLNVIIRTTGNFFRKIGFITIVYIVVLAFLFPTFLAKNFDFVYTALLVVIIGIGTVFTYLYGITYQMLLEADQRSYVYSIIQIITVICNTIAVVALVKINASIHLIKSASAVFYVIRPIALSIYIKKKYKLNLKVKPDAKVIAQRWDGFAQGLAYYIHTKTDIFVLTIFSSYVNVSIYGVYALVTSGLNALINSIDVAVRAAFGNILANDEDEHLKITFSAYNSGFHILCTIVFATASITVFKFIQVYVGHVKDADYIQPLFGLLIISAEYAYCLRLPYNSMIFAAGKFKETKRSAFIEAILNIVISIVLVYRFGLIGVAIGTLVAMIYRTISFIIYLHGDVLSLDFTSQIKRYGTSVLSYVISIWLLSKINVNVNSYLTWLIYAAIIFVLTSLMVGLINLTLDKENTIVAVKTFAFRKK